MKTTIRFAATVIMVASCSLLLYSFKQNLAGEIRVNPASVNGLADKIYADLQSGATDSLFKHLRLIYCNAGWKEGYVSIDNITGPVLIKQNYLIPFSRTSGYKITQSELMSDRSQGWKYWQMWTDSLTNGKWDPHKELKNEEEAYMLGNFTTMVIMAHELGHYYSEENNATQAMGGLWESAADHYAVGLLHDLADASPELKKLLDRFYSEFITDIYQNVPVEYRSAFEPGYSFYEHTFYFTLDYSIKKYASLQLLREKYLLDRKELNTSNCLELYEAGYSTVFKGDKVRMYSGKTTLVPFPQFNKEKNNIAEAGVAYAFMNYADPSGVFQNGELYTVSEEDALLTLLTLTPNFSEKKYDLSPIAASLDSVYHGGRYSSYTNNCAYVFSDTLHLTILVLQAGKTSQKQCVTQVNVDLSGAPRITGMFTDTLEIGFDYSNEIHFCSRTLNEFTVIIGYSDRIVARFGKTGLISSTKITSDARFSFTPDLNKNQSINKFATLTYDTAGNALLTESNFIKYLKNDELFTVSFNDGNEVRNGLNQGGLGISAKFGNPVWSPKYGFVIYDYRNKTPLGLKMDQ